MHINNNVKRIKPPLHVHRISGYTFNWVIAIVNAFAVALYNNPTGNQVFLGWLILLTSIVLTLRVRRAKVLFFLISIMTYINTSIVVLDCFYGGEMFNEYQWALRHSQYNQIYAKCILLNITVISLILTPKAIRKAISINSASIIFERKNNFIIAYSGIAIIVYALIFGYERIGDTTRYISNTKTIYEYAILVFIIVWYYSKENKAIKFLLPLCAMVYIVQGLYYGDRSSALVLMVLIGMQLVKKVSVSKMISLGILGIIFANLVAIYRDYGYIGLSSFINKLINRGALLLFSDTASQSYYAGITIVASRLLVPENPLYYLYKFIAAIFLGGSTAITKEANITLLVQQIYYSGGGGLYPSYFYFWGQYFGIIAGAFILGAILYKVFTKKTTYYILLQYTITIMCFRWYLYTPMTFFRSSIFIFSLLYALCYLADKLTSKKVKYF